MRTANHEASGSVHDVARLTLDNQFLGNYWHYHMSLDLLLNEFLLLILVADVWIVVREHHVSVLSRYHHSVNPFWRTVIVVDDGDLTLTIGIHPWKL